MQRAWGREGAGAARSSGPHNDEYGDALARVNAGVGGVPAAACEGELGLLLARRDAERSRADEGGLAAAHVQLGRCATAARGRD